MSICFLDSVCFSYVKYGALTNIIKMITVRQSCDTIVSHSYYKLAHFLIIIIITFTSNNRPIEISCVIMEMDKF